MQGQLFTSDFLREGIRATPGWNTAEPGFVAFREAVGPIFSGVSANTTLNEAQTEDELILPVLAALGWNQHLRQQAANRTGRADVPDFLLFESEAAKRAALAERKPDRRYRHGAVVLEAKRWQRALDRGDNVDPLDSGTPSSQMLRYLSRAEVASDRALQWGMLTNGGIWRLYWQSARSRSEEFLEFDLSELTRVANTTGDLFTDAAAGQVHYLRAFYLLFRREAFLPQPGDAEGRSFHAIALGEGRLWESKVSQDLGKRVFDELFPNLAAAIARNDPEAARPCTRQYLDEVHRATLILLYRLLFVLYAEDRNLLPTRDPRYDDYSLRWLRNDIGERMHRGDAFSTTAARAWQHLRGLFRAIDHGDDSIGLPPYNGGLFRESATDILARIELPDAELAPVIDGLSRRPGLTEVGFINYRDLAVQHLGSIYERLLEQQLIEDACGNVVVRPSAFARKNSGSYYTHDDLVKLILHETVSPLARERVDAFDTALASVAKRRAKLAPEQITRQLADVDPAEAILDLRICDPAMGSGHFLVSLVDDLADRVLEQLADASAKAKQVGIAHYASPVAREILKLRERIARRAEQGRWAIDMALLDDRHLVRRMILKRVVHGVDKNPMAVELAKLALWLHTFTVGAPLSFLDHHLRCGDSLYGERLESVRAGIGKRGGLLADSQLTGLLLAAQSMHEIGMINDVDLVEVERSRDLTAQAFSALDGIQRVLDFWQALRWLAPLDVAKSKWGNWQKAALDLISGRFGGDLLALLAPGRTEWGDETSNREVTALLAACRELAGRERFLHWELAFPGVWRNPGAIDAEGGFDAVIGNPPWDRMKLQEVEWFAERRPEIARQARASDRKKRIAQLRKEGDPLADDYELAARRAEDAARIARSCGDYPLLSFGDINLYSLFVERATRIVKPGGVVGLLTPSGIAADKGAARFFRSIATTGRLAALFDFENKKVFFQDIHASFKFCVLVFGGTLRRFDTARCAFYLHAVRELDPPAVPDDADATTRLRAMRVIELSADDFRVVNPNTGTAPIFRNALDAVLTTRIYRRYPVLVRHVFARETDELTGETIENVERVEREDRLYPVRYRTMFHMTNDSSLFHRRDELEADGWYPVAGGRWKKGDAQMLPLYEGKMVQMYDHRAAGVTVNPDNVHRSAQPFETSDAQHRDPDYVPPPQFLVAETAVARDSPGLRWSVAFKDVTAPTNARTMIAAIIPESGVGNTLPMILGTQDCDAYAEFAPLLLANIAAFACDYFARQKVQGQHLNWFIVEQLPLIAPAAYAQPLGTTTIGDFVRGEVLRLSYTAHDLAAFARDLGHIGPPFPWDAEDRRHRMARLDALYFMLYGLDRDEVSYVLDTFPVVREQDEAAFGGYRTRNLVLGYMNALAAGDTTTVLAL
jgi:hypothetical protein